VRTLLVDGNNLLKIGFHGAKNLYSKDKKVGGIFHFLNTLRKQLTEYNYDKILVFWDGEYNSLERRKILAEYKANRIKSDDFDTQSFYEQKNRIQLYLEEFFVRQVERAECESDDLIAFYTQNSDNEQVTIYSGDKDLTQLMKENVWIYNPFNGLIKYGEKIQIVKELYVPSENVAVFKIFCGDTSDNINGVYFLGEKTLVKLFPDLLTKKMEVEDVLDLAEKLFEENKNNKTLQNLLTGKTKDGIFEKELYDINRKLIDLRNPILTQEAKNEILSLINESLDPDGRSYKQAMKLMREDGLYNFLPRGDNAWVDFITPFMKLTRKEKQTFKKQKK
jgi:5'-3' exonuclease